MQHAQEESLHILHIAAGLWKRTGGPATSVCGYCAALARAGCRVTLATLDGPLAEGVYACREAGVDVQLFPLTGGQSVGYSRQMATALPRLVESATLVHTHGIWQYPNWQAGALARSYHKPLIVSPHGCLDPWCLRKSRVKKWLVAQVFSNHILRQAACLHATAVSELDGFRQYGLRQPAAVIPIGVDLPHQQANPELVNEQFPSCRGKRLLLYLSRIHPVKGPLDLVNAWRIIAPAHPDWHLLIAGPDDQGHLAAVLDAINKAGLAERTTYAGPLYGDARAAALAAAELFVLPTHSENFAIVVAEALAAGVPVITTHGAPWEGIPAHNCGWWVPVGAEALAEALHDALTLTPHELGAMGNRGQAWMLDEFSWEAVAREMLAMYQWVRGESISSSSSFSSS
ncbi:MAG: glycosyltransferase [Armatimonadota bacterium]